MQDKIKKTTEGIIPYLLKHGEELPPLDPITEKEFDEFFEDITKDWKPRPFYIWDGERLCLIEPEDK